MSLSGPAPPAVQDPNITAATQQGINTQTANQQQGINASTAGLQDYYNQLTAGRQTAANTATGTENQAGSMVNQNNAFGSLNYNQSGTGPGGVPLYTAGVGLNPQLQGIVNSLMGQTGSSLAGANYGAQNPSDVIGGMTTGTTKDLLNTWSSYMQPQYDYAEDRLTTQLKNQGFTPGTPGYDKALNALRFDQGQQKNQFLVSAEPTAYSQAVQNYMMPLTTSTAEMGLLGQVPGMVSGSFVNAPGLNIAPTSVANTGVGGTTVGATDYTGAVKDYNNANMAAYNAKVAANGNMMSGLFGIPSSILGGWAKGGFPGMGGGSGMSADGSMFFGQGSGDALQASMGGGLGGGVFS